MVRRLGVGATAASAVIFTLLLTTSALLFESSLGREALYSKANAEDELTASAAALMGAGAINLLIEAQASLSSATLSCSTAMSVVAEMIGQLSNTQVSNGLRVTVSAELAPDVGAEDNLTMLVPYNGSEPGATDFSLVGSESGSDAGAGVSLSRVEGHRAHLPIRLQRMADDCKEGFDRIVGAISTSVPGNCTPSAVAPMIQQAARGPAEAAAVDGFSFNLGYSVVTSPGCGANLRLVMRSDAQGPGGPFSVQVEQSGYSSFATPAS